MDNITIQDYAAMQELQCSHKRGWGATAAIWVLVAAVIILAVVYNWTRNCNEKVQFSTALAELGGRIKSLEPAVTAQGNNLYSLNGTVSATVQGVGDIKECLTEKINTIENQLLFRSRSGCNGSCGNREFRQSQVYNLASQQVTVDETCRN